MRSGIYNVITRFFLERFDPYQYSDEPPKAEFWPYLRSFLRPLRGILLASLIVTAAAAAMEVWLIQYAGQIIDTLAASSPKTLWAEHGRGLTIAALIVIFFRPALQFLKLLINDITVDCNIANLVRWRAYDHLAKQSVGWFQEDLTGRTSARLVDIGNYVADSIYKVITTVGFGLVYMIGVVILMAGTEIWLAVPLILWLAFYIGVLIFVIPRMVRAQQRFQGAKSALIGSVVDSFSNFETIKLFAPRDHIMAEQKRRLEDTRQTLFQSRQIGTALRTTLISLEAIVMVGFVGYGVWLWMSEQASIGLVSASIALSIRITTMADWILDSIWHLFLRVGSLREALLTIGQPLTIPQDPDAPALEVGGGDIQFDAVRHHYGLDTGGLQLLDLHIASGEKIGIVGRSGAGKSTLVNLLLRFFEVEEGAIRINGQDIRSVEQDSLRAAIGVVSQQAALLNRSVRDNILLGRTDVSDEELYEAARRASAHDFIMGLKDNKGRMGYDAHVGERGVKLSGGQRQRIALARVILKDAPILVLDEATSALDSEVEAEIQASLQAIMANKTVIAIAHRLSTIAQMDRICVMDGGRIAEVGDHATLAAGEGLYARFWQRQSDGFISTED